LRSRAERSKDRNKATAVATKLQRSNALICFTEHTLKHIENKALLCYATQKCEPAFTVAINTEKRIKKRGSFNFNIFEKSQQPRRLD